MKLLTGLFRAARKRLMATDNDMGLFREELNKLVEEKDGLSEEEIATRVEEIKTQGYVYDADNLPPREWADGNLHEKVNGVWHEVKSEKKGVAARLRDEFTENTKKYINTNFSNKATECLREIANHSMIKPLESADGLKAELSYGKVNKILSGKAASKSCDLKAHLEAAANIDHLFRISVRVIEPHPDTKGNRGIKFFLHIRPNGMGRKKYPYKVYNQRI